MSTIEGFHCTYNVCTYHSSPLCSMSFFFYLFQFAYCYPYTYSRLQQYLEEVEKLKPEYYRRELLCHSVVSQVPADCTNWAGFHTLGGGGALFTPRRVCTSGVKQLVLSVCRPLSVQIMPFYGGLGHASPEKFRKNSCPEIESGGFWQLADYPTLVFKITAF